MSNVNYNSNYSSARQSNTIGEHNNVVSLVKAKLAALGKLHAKLTTLCTTIEDLSTELVRETSENTEMRRYLGEETHHLVFAAKNIEKALDKYNDAVKFVKDCFSLRYNDAPMTRINHHGLLFPPINYPSVIGDCLRHNTRVTELTLYLDTMFERDFDSGMMHQIRDLLCYIANSTALCQVNVYCSDKTVIASVSEWTLASILLETIGKNPCIDELQWDACIPCFAFRSLLLTTKSLKTLRIECAHWQKYSRTEKSMILESLAGNQSVEHLDLHGDDADWTMTGSVLRTLSRGQPNPPLRQLSLGGTGPNGQLHHLAHFLQSTTTLVHLELQDFDFVMEQMNIVVHGLELHYARPAASITRLSFTRSSFDDEAAKAFIQFMQTPIPRTTDGTARSGTILQELHMGAKGEDVTVFAGVPLGSAMVSLLTTTAATTSNPIQPPSSSIHDGQDTIGSQLRLLSVDPLHSVKGFCDAIRSQAWNIRLPCLCLSLFATMECWELGQWLPYVTSLEQLHISAVC